MVHGALAVGEDGDKDNDAWKWVGVVKRVLGGMFKKSLWRLDINRIWNEIYRRGINGIQEGYCRKIWISQMAHKLGKLRRILNIHSQLVKRLVIVVHYSILMIIFKFNLNRYIGLINIIELILDFMTRFKFEFKWVKMLINRID